MNVFLHRNFRKAARRLTNKQKDILAERLALFADNPYHPLLNNHRLNGIWRRYRSINIAGDLRAVYAEVDQETAQFVELGTHSQLYSS